MCGWFNLDREPVDREAFERVLSALDDYGLDGADRHCDGPVALGHQMTWLTPQSKQETLPFYDSQANLTITADARIDNRDELCEKLELSEKRARDSFVQSTRRAVPANESRPLFF